MTRDRRTDTPDRPKPPRRGGPPRTDAARPRHRAAPEPDRPANRPKPAPRNQGPRPTPPRRDARDLRVDAPSLEHRPAAPEKTPPGTYWLHGLHAVAAALANPRRGVKRLLLTEDAESTLAARLPEGWRRRAQAERTDRARFQTFLPEDAVHQGAALLVHPLDPPPIEEVVATCVIVQDRHAPPESAAMARAASGALETVPLLREVNLARALRWLQTQGFWTIGLSADAGGTLAETLPRDRRIALVLGAEDSGLRRLQRETCDALARLPITAEIESLNVSAAAAVALYEIARGAA